LVFFLALVFFFALALTALIEQPPFG